jgi:hypothetical protein
MDSQCLYGIFITKPLSGNLGIHDGCPKIHHTVYKHDFKRSSYPNIANKPGL